MTRGGGRARRGVAVALAVSVLSWTACDGTGDSALPGRASPRAEPRDTSEDGAARFVTAANRVCDRSEERMDQVEAPRAPEGWLEFGRRLQRRFGDTHDRLAALDPPEDLADDYRRWLRLLNESGRAFRSVYRTVALRYPSVEGPHDRVDRATGRADRADRKTRQFAQLRLTDLSSCYDVMPFMHARTAATAACGGFLFCE